MRSAGRSPSSGATLARCPYRLSAADAFHWAQTTASNVESRMTPCLSTCSASATRSNARPRLVQHFPSSPLATMVPLGAHNCERSTRPSVSRRVLSTTLIQDNRCNVLCTALPHSALHAGPTGTPHIVPSRPCCQQHSSWSQLPALTTQRLPSQPQTSALRIPGIPQHPIPTAPKQYSSAHGDRAPTDCADGEATSASNRR